MSISQGWILGFFLCLLSCAVRRCEIVGGASRFLVATHPTNWVWCVARLIVGGASRFLVAIHFTITIYMGARIPII
ncbi:hypothetical protein [Microcoleus sp. bin48.metabat.b7b8b9.023]|nr:hypothetical protein [Microcoleus sp. bin48.metabat.b7b8b9.023]